MKVTLSPGDSICPSRWTSRGMPMKIYSFHNHISIYVFVLIRTKKKNTAIKDKRSDRNGPTEKSKGIVEVTLNVYDKL